MLIHVDRDGEQFGPYAVEDLNAYLAQGSILLTDQAWYEGAAGWMPMDQVPGVVLPGATADSMAQPPAIDPHAAVDPAVVTADVVDISSGVAHGTKEKKILVISGSIAGVAALAGVLCFVWPGFLKSGDEGTNGEVPKKNGGGNNKFAVTVEPIFKKHNCYDCHSSVGGKVKEDLDFDTPDTVKPLLKNGELVRRLLDKGDDRMPPKGDMLSAADVDKVKAWIAAGGKF